MNSESYIKSSIANLIVSLMLKEVGYAVLPLRDNNVLDRLVDDGVGITKISKLLLNIPSFIVIDKNKKSFLVSVKFRGEGKSGRNIDWGYKQLSELWPNSVMVVVSNVEPHFSVVADEVINLSESILRVNKKNKR